MASSEPLYAPEQIVIPPGLPEILKQFTKAAIKTQPANIYQWAHAYFAALSKGESPPSEERVSLERTQNYPIVEPSSTADQTKSDEEEEVDAITMLSNLFQKLVTGPAEIAVDDIQKLSDEHKINSTSVADALGLLNASDSVAWVDFLTLLCGTANDATDHMDTLNTLTRVIASEGFADASLIKKALSFLVGLDDTLNNGTKESVTKSIDAVTTDGKVPLHWSTAPEPKQEAEEPKQEAEEPKQEAEEPKQEAEDPKQEAEAPKQEAEEPKQEAEEPKQEAEAPKQEAKEPKQEDSKDESKAE